MVALTSASQTISLPPPLVIELLFLMGNSCCVFQVGLALRQLPPQNWADEPGLDNSITQFPGHYDCFRNEHVTQASPTSQRLGTLAGVIRKEMLSFLPPAKGLNKHSIAFSQSASTKKRVWP